MQYNIIYADPPWQYRQKKGQGVAENHYPAMHSQDIHALSIDTIAHKYSVMRFFIGSNTLKGVDYFGKSCRKNEKRQKSCCKKS